VLAAKLCCRPIEWPISWADGQPVMNKEGTESYLNKDEMKAIYSAFRDMVKDGTVLMPDSETEAGPTWTGYFPKGIIGIMPMPLRACRPRLTASQGG